MKIQLFPNIKSEHSQYLWNMQYNIVYSMFIVHNNACRPFTRWFPDRVFFKWGCGLAYPLQRWWLMLVVMILSYVRKKGSSANMPLLPKAFSFSPTLGTKSVTHWWWVSLPPGTQGKYQPLALGLVSWVLTYHVVSELGYHEQGVNRPLR